MIDAVHAGLDPSMAAKVRTDAPVRDGPAMFIDFSGACDKDPDFVEAVRTIVEPRGGSEFKCSMTAPDT